MLEALKAGPGPYLLERRQACRDCFAEGEGRDGTFGYEVEVTGCCHKGFFRLVAQEIICNMAILLQTCDKIGVLHTSSRFQGAGASLEAQLLSHIYGFQQELDQAQRLGRKNRGPATVFRCAYMCEYTHICMYTYRYVIYIYYIYIYTYISCVYINVYLGIYVRVYVHVHTYMFSCRCICCFVVLHLFVAGPPLLNGPEPRAMAGDSPKAVCLTSEGEGQGLRQTRAHSLDLRRWARSFSKETMLP